MQGVTFTVIDSKFSQPLGSRVNSDLSEALRSFWKSEPNLKVSPKHTVWTQISQETGCKPALILTSAFTFLADEAMKAV